MRAVDTHLLVRLIARDDVKQRQDKWGQTLTSKHFWEYPKDSGQSTEVFRSQSLTPLASR